MAVSFAWLDDGTHHRLNLTGSGTATVEDCYDYLYTLAGDAETYMTRTGSLGAYVYSFVLAAHPGESHQQIYVNSGVTLQHEAGDTLNFEWAAATTTTDWMLYVYENGCFQMDAGSTVDGNSTGATYGRSRWGIAGRLIVNGTEANPCTLQNFRDVYCYMQEEDVSQYWDVNWMVFKDFTYVAGSLRMFGTIDSTGYQGLVVPHVFKNCTLSDSQGWGYWYIQVDFSGWTMEGWTVDNLEIVDFRNGAVGTIKDSEFKNIDSLLYAKESGQSSLHYQRYNTYRTPSDLYWYTGLVRNQPLLLFDTCTFDAVDAGVYAIGAYSGSVVGVKSPTFKNQSQQLYLQYSHFLLYGGEPTFVNCSKNYTWAAAGALLHVRMLTLTVNDPDGNPLENACVMVRQKEGKEFWEFLTDSNGQVVRNDGLGVFLVEREERLENTYVDWSDGSGDKVHVITVSHPDYPVHTEEIAMTEDKTRTITLNNVGGTNIYDSTLYDSTIY